MATKPIAMMALERMGKDDGADALEGGSEGSEGLAMAMQDLLAAIEAKDAGAMVEAFKSAVAMADND